MKKVILFCIFLLLLNFNAVAAGNQAVYLNYDGTVLSDNGGTPVRPDSNGHYYIFSGWTESGEGEYTAQYDEFESIIIKSESDFLNITSHMGGHYYLANDIVLKNNFIPIGGCYGLVFSGTFDGGGHTVYNVVIPEYYDEAQHMGFFGKTDGATIKDLNVRINYGGENDNHYMQFVAGGFVGTALNTIIKDCSVKGNINLYENELMLGGFGYMFDNCKIYDCFADVNITSKASTPYIGAMAYQADSTDFENCYVTGKITLENISDISGFVFDANYSNFNNCYSNIETESDYSFNYRSARFLKTNGNCTFTNCVYNADSYTLGGADSVASGLTADELKAYNFNNSMWATKVTENKGFPYLKHFENYPIGGIEVKNCLKLENGIMSGNVSLDFMSDKEIQSKIMFAIYDSNKRLVLIKPKDIAITQSKNTVIFNNISYNKDDLLTYYARLYILQSDGFVPLCKTITE